MLANFLKFHQRGERRFSSDRDIVNFENNMIRLHADDQAVLHYFGLDRGQLASHVKGPINAQPLPPDGETALVTLQKKIARLDAINTEAETPPRSNEDFYWFGYRFFLYFIDEFKSDKRYLNASTHIDEQALLSSLEGYVLDRIGRTSEQSLVHYLNTQISKGYNVELAELSQQLRTLSLTSFFESYPVLASLLFGLLEDTVDYLFAVILDFAADIEYLQNIFSIPSRKIDAIEFGLGDPHGRGETVCRVEVCAMSLVYKPRASREALFFNRLLRQLYEQTGAECFSIYAPRIVSRERHSWIEKIENTPCKSEADVELFYRKMGTQIAVIYALNGIDFHHENIIACGSNPVMIDLECLFTASTSDLLFDLPADSALFKAFKLTRQSVFSSGFVPFAQGSGNDLSGLTRQERFDSTGKSLVYESGFYHLRKISIEHRPLHKHLPLLAGERKGLEAYKEAFFHGFEYAYDALMTHQQIVVQMLEQSADELSTRVLIKNTQRYAEFIGLSRHPRFMQNMLDRELLLATLWNDLKDAYLAKGIPRYEITDLQRLSIPCFTMPLNSNYLVSAQGETIEMAQVEPPIKSCRQKIENMSRADRVLQRTILETCLFPKPNEHQPLNLKHVHTKVESPLQTERLESVMRIAACIEELAVTDAGSGIRWLSFHTHPTTHKKYLSPMGNGLYSGIAGLGLFYLSLFKVSDKPHYLSCADQVLHSLAQSFGYFKSDLSVSAYHGLGSYIYLLVSRQQITGDQRNNDKLEELLIKLINAPLEDYDFDFLGGCCGAVTLLANIYELYPREDVLPAIRRMVEYIKGEVTIEDNRFFRRNDRSVILTGLSHGLSGVIHAVCKAYDVTHDESLVPLAIQLLEGENRWIRDGFWLDLRDMENPGHLAKWCHGDGGILIARRQLLKSMGDAMDESTRQKVNDDISRCESNLWRHGLGSGYSLCHGDFGNLICLYNLYRESRNHQGVSRVEQAFDEVAHNFFEGNFLGGNQVPDISLLTGISGVGYALLYGIDPTIPNILSLDFGVPA
ncbi:type 2 lanthipeptide synthetase LanM [Pseudomonas lini]|uniref:type 2 lanthipeptide synthetase LanM n=1 Tax=Pseudomonas lini TaxID=163011 RepID=UPI00345EEAE8